MLLTAACSIDAYDKGEGEYSLMTAEMADVVVDNQKYVTTVQTDQDEQFNLAKQFTMKWMEKGDTTYRALVYYKLLTNGQAEAVSMSKVAVLIPAMLKSKEGKQADMKDDPLFVESAWMSKNQKYVNMRLRLLTGTSNDEKAVQTIGMVIDSLNSSNGHLRLMLYHDQGGQPEYYSSTAYVSIPLDNTNTDTLTVTANTYNGLFTRTFLTTTD